MPALMAELRESASLLQRAVTTCIERGEVPLPDWT